MLPQELRAAFIAMHYEIQTMREKLEIVDFSLITPVSTRFTNYFVESLKNAALEGNIASKFWKPYDLGIVVI